MSSFDDKEFGKVTIRKSARAKSMKVSVAPTGELRISLPSYVPQFMAKRMIANSRQEIRDLLAMRPNLKIEDGMAIGKSHSLHIRSGTVYSLKRVRQQVVLTLPDGMEANDPQVQNDVRAMIITSLRKEAKHHLPKRLGHLATIYGFSYASVRFTHASSRWGSCNQHKAISLNIALMNIPFELIDYVLLHELAHTVELNHSKDFWSIVASADPDYKDHKKALKNYSPHI